MFHTSRSEVVRCPQRYHCTMRQLLETQDPHTFERDRKPRWERVTVVIDSHEIVCMIHDSLDVFVLLQSSPRTVGIFCHGSVCQPHFRAETVVLVPPPMFQTTTWTTFCISKLYIWMKHGGCPWHVPVIHLFWHPPVLIFTYVHTDIQSSPVEQCSTPSHTSITGFQRVSVNLHCSTSQFCVFEVLFRHIWIIVPSHCLLLSPPFFGLTSHHFHRAVVGVATRKITY